MKLNIGDTLKKIRNQKNLSIRDLAKKSDLSPTALSNIERNVNSPSVDSLAKICYALDIHLVDLFDDNEENHDLITRFENRSIFDTSEDSNISYEFVSLSKKDFKMMQITMKPKCNFGYIVQNFPSDEIGLVIQGQLELVIEDETQILNKGDSIYLKANTTYKYRNIGQSECISLWAIQGKQ